MNVFQMREGFVRDEDGHENAGRVGLRGPSGFFCMRPFGGNPQRRPRLEKPSSRPCPLWATAGEWLLHPPAPDRLEGGKHYRSL